MNQEYSDSLFPWGIPASFIIILALVIGMPPLVYKIVGLFLHQKDLNKGNGIIPIIGVLVIFFGPSIYNKRISPFERKRAPLKIIDYLGALQGMRGAAIRLLLYQEGFEIRAFYHRYYIPFDKIDGVSVEKMSFSSRIYIETQISGVPGYLTLPDSQQLDLASIIQDQIRHNYANAADVKSRATDYPR